MYNIILIYKSVFMSNFRITKNNLYIARVYSIIL